MLDESSELLGRIAAGEFQRVRAGAPLIAAAPPPMLRHVTLKATRPITLDHGPSVEFADLAGRGPDPLQPHAGFAPSRRGLAASTAEHEC